MPDQSQDAHAPAATVAPPERRLRSIAKAISWRITGSIDTIILAFFFTHNLKVATAIGFAEIGTKTILYYVHERAWARVLSGRLGLHPQPPTLNQPEHGAQNPTTTNSNTPA